MALLLRRRLALVLVLVLLPLAAKKHRQQDWAPPFRGCVSVVCSKHS